MELPKRKPNRLKSYDYSQNGAYFITICAKDRENLFCDYVVATSGRPRSPAFTLSECGREVEVYVQNIERIYPMVTMKKYVIMPNHVHLLLMIASRGSGRPMVAPTVSIIINQMKGVVTKKVGVSCWQKSFHDHIIRDENEFLAIWNYIDTNPTAWEEDCFYRA